MKLPFEITLALRGLRPRNRGTNSFMAAIAVIGIASGTASLIFVLALARGFRAEIERQITANTPHIAIHPADFGSVPNWHSVIADAGRIPGIADVTAESSYQALAQAGERTAIVDVVTEDITSTAGDGDRSTFTDIGAELGERLKVSAGDNIQLSVIASSGDAQMTTLTVRSLFRSGIYAIDANSVKVSPAVLRTILRTNELEPQFLKVSVSELDRTDEIARRLEETIVGRGLNVLTWKDVNRPLFQALEREKTAAIAFLGVILFLSMLNIAACLLLSVSERRLDIAVFRTMGASRRSIVSIFLTQGAILAVAGVVFGLAAGWIACYVTNAFNLLKLPAEVYSISSARMVATISDSLIVAAIVMLSAILASFIPAFRAAKIRPSENLRNA